MIFNIGKKKVSEEELNIVKNNLMRNGFKTGLLDIEDLILEFKSKGLDIEQIKEKIIERRREENKPRTAVKVFNAVKNNDFDSELSVRNSKNKIQNIVKNNNADDETNNINSKNSKENKNKQIVLDALKKDLDATGLFDEGELEGIDNLIKELQAKGLSIQEIKSFIIEKREKEIFSKKEELNESKSFADKIKDRKEKEKNSEMSL